MGDRMKAIEVFLIEFSKRQHHLPRGTFALMLIAEFLIMQGNDQLLVSVGGFSALAMLTWIMNQPPKEENNGCS